MIEFVRPYILVLLILNLVPFVYRKRSAERYSSFMALPMDRVSCWLNRLKYVLYIGFISAAVVSLAEPIAPLTQMIRWSRASVIVFVVDQSGSMTTTFYKPGNSSKISKLQIALDSVEEFAKRYPDNALGLVGFGDGSVIYLYPTTNRERFESALSIVQLDMGGTIIDMALWRALSALDTVGGQPGARAVILLSDGEGRVEYPDTLTQYFMDTGTYLYWLRIESMPGLSTKPMDNLMADLGPWGKVFDVGTVDELPQALDAVGRLQQMPIPLSYENKQVPLVFILRCIALGCLLGLAVFVFARRWRR